MVVKFVDEQPSEAKQPNAASTVARYKTRPPLSTYFLDLFSIFALALAAWGAELQVDFSREAGPVKPLHGVNNGPLRPVKEAPERWHQNEFKAAGIPFMRTHDTVGMWGGTHYVDIPNIFPNFEADENDPKNYDFLLTDLVTVIVAETGANKNCHVDLPVYEVKVKGEGEQWCLFFQMKLHRLERISSVLSVCCRQSER